MLPTNPRDYIELLEVFRIGVINKVLDTQRIIDWADAIIEQDAAPDYFVIELAMCGGRNTNDLISLLNGYIGENKPCVSGRIILGLLYQEYTLEKIDLYRAVRTIDWLVLNSYFTDEEYRLMCGVDDDYSLAVEGVHGSVSAVADYVLRFLAFYQPFQLENMTEWKDLNESVSKKVQALYHTTIIS